MSSRFERSLSTVLTLAAVVMAISLVHREWFAAHLADARPLARPAQRVSNWRAIARAGIPLDDGRAPITILEFADFECPYCRRFEASYRAVKERLPRQTNLVFVHLPLTSIHRFAMPAARAAECARLQGRFQAFHDLLYQKQDSLGLISWSSMASQAGVADTLAFLRCNLSRDSMPAITDGLAEAAKLNIHSTPTLIVNGWLVPTPAGDSTLIALVRAAAHGDDSLRGFINAR